MNALRRLLGAALLCVAVGCGQQGPGGEVAGIVMDTSGNPVAGATVSLNGGDPTTVTNSGGKYVLTNLSGSDEVIRADLVVGSASYIGSNMASLTDPGLVKNVNIVLVPTTQSAAIRATVYDAQNNRVANARVYALSTVATVGSSSMAVTDSHGACDILNLIGGQSYKVMAVFAGMQSTPATVVPAVGQTRAVSFTLAAATDVAIPAPSNLTVSVWTTPHESTDTGDSGDDNSYDNGNGSDEFYWAPVYEAAKNRLDPHRAASVKATRSTIRGNDVEVDLSWDPLGVTQLSGFGVFRVAGTTDPTVAVDYDRDPMGSFYADNDHTLVPAQSYSYQLTSRNALYPASTNGESAKSARVTAVALDELNVIGTTGGPGAFQWHLAAGATEYTVYVFNRLPNLASIAPVWTSAPTAGNTVTYTGPALVSRRTYYYYVVGDDGAHARTISRVTTFRAQ